MNDERIAEIRKRIHELYQQPESSAHERELIRLHAELARLFTDAELSRLFAKMQEVRK